MNRELNEQFLRNEYSRLQNLSATGQIQPFQQKHMEIVRDTLQTIENERRDDWQNKGGQSPNRT